MTKPDDKVWKDSDLAKKYLEGVRGAIPAAAEQIDVMLRLLGTVPQGVQRFIDIGCGDGVLGAAILSQYPKAHGVFIDFSDSMLEAAREQFQGNDGQRIEALDYGDPEWVAAVEADAPYDAIVSGFSIHHQPDRRKRELYEEIYDLLAPGGFFVNVEHVTASSDIGARIFGERFIDSLYALEREQGGARSREQIAQEYFDRQDKEANILAPVEVQCDWLRHIGYADVDCHLKLYELAVFAGRKPAA